LSEKANEWASKYDRALERQLEYDPAGKTYTVRCAVCGKVHTLKKTLFMTRYRAFQKLRMKFNFCDTCGKWICEDCFYIDDGKGGMIGICIPCAKERGSTGLTLAQFEEAWPQIQERRIKRIIAARKANEKLRMKSE
jgi:hypothetical protein